MRKLLFGIAILLLVLPVALAEEEASGNSLSEANTSGLDYGGVASIAADNPITQGFWNGLARMNPEKWALVGALFVGILSVMRIRAISNFIHDSGWIIIGLLVAAILLIIFGVVF